LHVPADTPVDKMTELSLSHLALLFKQQIPAHEVACIVIEPVLGEGGYVPAPKAWLQGLREVCDREGIVLGEPRVGSLFAPSSCRKLTWSDRFLVPLPHPT